MNYFFDTSALIKNYIEEPGSAVVAELMGKASAIFVSELTLIECFSTLRRILLEKLISENEYDLLKKEISYDFDYFKKIEYSASIGTCERLIDTYQLKTLDSIQLAASLNVEEKLGGFICCDSKLVKAARYENLKVINPLDQY